MLNGGCYAKLIAIGLFSTMGLAAPALAQIVPDGTLGAESSRLTPNVVIRGGNADRIDGGASRGGNLFHSFSDFNIGDGQRLYFANPTGIQTIFTRVTGNTLSNINGTLGVDGAASLFLLNPNGILFGQNARLDLQGSFVGTTANSIRFGDQGTFSANNPQAVPLLTIQPSALVFTQVNSGKIVSESIAPVGQSPIGRNLLGLRVPDGQNLLLIGGDVEINGKGKDGGLNAQGGRIELGGLINAGEIALDPQYRLNFSANAVRSNLVLANTARISVRGNGGGDIVVNAETLTADGGGRLVAGTEGPGNAGNIIVNANKLDLSANGLEFGVGSTGVLSNQVLGNSAGNGGDIIVNANSLSLSSNATINTTVLGKGNGGKIIINAKDSIVLNKGYITAPVLKNAIGTSGEIYLITGSLSLLNGSQIDSNTLGKGSAGNIQIAANNQVLVDGFRSDKKISSSIVSTVKEGGQGNSGNISLSTGSLVISNGGTIKATSEGEGNAGNIRVAARDYISLDGTQRNNTNGGLYSQAAYSTGRSGDIEITARSLSLTNGAQIDVASFNFDRIVNDTGNITVFVQDKLSIDGANDYVNSRIRNTINSLGKGGNIDIQTGSLFLTNGGLIDSSTRDEATAGNIKIQARTIRIEGASLKRDFGGTYSNRSGIYSIVEQFAVGQGGNIDLTTGSLLLSDRGIIAAFTEGRGNAGNITIRARDIVSVDGRNEKSSSNGGIYSTVEDKAKGRGGNINLAAGSLLLSNGGVISASTFGSGDAGNIDIAVRDQVKIDGIRSNSGSFGSGIFSNISGTGKGAGGNINLISGSLFLSNGGSIGASTFGTGTAGNIKIAAREQVMVDGVMPNGKFRSGIFSNVSTGGTGQGGNIILRAESLLVSNGGSISASTFSSGNAGNLEIAVQDQIKIDGVSSDGEFYSGIFSSINSAGKGNGGNINLTSGSLSVLNGGGILASTFGIGNAGNITVAARDQVVIDGVTPDGESSSGIFSNVSAGGKGQGGDITLRTGSFWLSNGGVIAASTFGVGDAGRTQIVARDQITIEGERSGNRSGVYATVNASAKGIGGKIDLTTGSLFLSQGGLITASTFGLGNAGDIRVRARDTIAIDAQTGSRSGIYSAIDQSRSRQIRGGNIILETGTLALNNGGIISANSKRLGRAGDVAIRAGNKVEIIGSSTNGVSEINLVANGSSASGNLNLQSPSLVLKDRGAIRAEANFSDPGGNITLSVDQLLMRRQARISAIGGLRSNGGNIEINSDSIVAPLSENSDITANAFRGNGGNIRINARAIFGIKARSQPTPESDITASSDRGVQGTIAITQPDTSPEQGLIQLPSNIIDASNQIGQSCPNASNNRSIGRFVVSGRGSLPSNPLDRIADNPTLPPLAQLPQGDRALTQTIPSSPVAASIVEAKGWQKSADGNVVLIGQPVPKVASTGSCPPNSNQPQQPALAGLSY
jgi:filamentous hemagglutinin family protein